MLELGAVDMAKLVRDKEISSRELVAAHLERIASVNPRVNAVVTLMADQALIEADSADSELAHGELRGPLHGVPFSVKDSIDVAGVKTTAGTWGRRNADPASKDAALVRRLRENGGIPIAKTNLPDLLFSFETDNLIFGRTNNPYDLEKTPGGSSGGESALIAAHGSPLGLGSDCLGSVRVPAAFCGIASLKPTSGRLARNGHVPPAGLWFEALWQIGPMARSAADLELAMRCLTLGGEDWMSPPAPLFPPEVIQRVAFFTDNGFARCSPEIESAVRNCAAHLASTGIEVTEARPPGVEHAYELELGLLGADGCEGIDAYLHDAGSDRVHPLLDNFTSRMRLFCTDAAGFARRWQEWDDYRAAMQKFFAPYDAVICPVYTGTALRHGESMGEAHFHGFSYTMAWSVAGYPAATVPCGESGGLPINVQVVAKPWRDLTALAACKLIQYGFPQPVTAHLAI